MEIVTLIVYAIIALYPFICAAFGGHTAAEKGRSWQEGALFGFFMGPLGVIAVACLPMVTGPRSRTSSAAATSASAAWQADGKR